MRTLRVFTLLALLSSSGLFAALTTDGIDTTTYGIWNYKWKWLIDPMEVFSMKSPYTIFKLSGLTAAAPFITSYDYGFAAKLGEHGGLTAAISYADTSANYSTNNIVNNVTGASETTNGASQTNLNYVQSFNGPEINRTTRTLGGSLMGFTRLGDAEVSLQYMLATTLSSSATNVDQSSEYRTTNGGYVTGYTRQVSNASYINDALTHTLALGYEAGILQGTVNFVLKDTHGNFDNSNYSVVTTKTPSGSGVYDSLLVTKLDHGQDTGATATGLYAPGTIVGNGGLRNTTLNLNFSQRIKNLFFGKDTKWYIGGGGTIGAFGNDKSDAMSYYSVTQTATKNTNGTTTNFVSVSNAVGYTKPIYYNVNGNLRMRKRFDLSDTVKFGIYPQYNFDLTHSELTRTKYQETTVQADTNGVDNLGSSAFDTKDVNSTNVKATFSGTSSSRNSSVGTHTISLPVAFDWNISKMLRLSVGTRLQYIITQTWDTYVQANGLDANLTGMQALPGDFTTGIQGQNVVAGSEFTSGTVTSGSRTTSYSQTAKQTTTSTYSTAFNFNAQYSAAVTLKPADQLEFQVALMAGNTFNLAAATGSPFVGADLSVIYNF